MQASEAAHLPTMIVDAELSAPGICAQIVRFDIPEPTDTRHALGEGYHVNMCLTPRPLNRVADTANAGARTVSSDWVTSSRSHRANRSTFAADAAGRPRWSA